MKFQDLFGDSLRSLQYLERYVNDGSPSGFTEKHNSSPKTNPFKLTPWFNPLVVKANSNNFSTYGTVPEILNHPMNDSQDWIICHPDLKDYIAKLNKKNKFDIEIYKELKVVPTSSSRTVQVLNSKKPDYLKLHYNQLLGRVNRALPYRKAVAGPEISQEIKQHLKSGGLNSDFTFLPELGAKILSQSSQENENEIGMIYRSYQLIGKKAKKIKYRIPLFSLFSVDRLASFDKPVICQIIDSLDLKPIDYALKIIESIVNNYFSLIAELGLLAEWNAQNLLLGFSEDYKFEAIIVRDLNEIEKDIDLRKSNNQHIDFDSAPYKCISSNDEVYSIRHSFSFDFKLSHYAILPIINVITNNYSVDFAELKENVKDVVNNNLKKLPDDYFPSNGMWYKHDDILLTGKRPYIPINNPLFR